MPRKSVLVLSGICLALSCLLAPPVWGQTSRGAIVGAVRDPSGALVPEAKVTATNVATTISFSYITDATGSFYIPSLLPGRYRVEVEKAGFKKFVAGDVLVEVNQTVRVDVTLELGAMTQAVEVQAAATPLVSTDQATLGQVVTNRQVNELPLNGRDFTNLLRLNVGVGELQGGIMFSIRQHGLNDTFRSVSVNGARPASVSFTIDGVSVNDPLFQGVSSVPPIDAIDEFKLQNGLYSADFGMGAGQVNVALKSGTNSLHAAIWDFLRNDALQPANPRVPTTNAFNPTCQAAKTVPPCTAAKTPLRQNQFGFTVGGPVELPHVYSGKNRTFFFGSYQGGRRVVSTIGQAQVPTDQEKQGNFSDWPTQLYNPLTTVTNPAFDRTKPLSATNTPVLRTPFGGNQILGSMIAPTSQNLVKYWPSPNLTCGLPCPNYQATVSSSVNTDQYLVRIDHNRGSSDRLFGQWLFQKEVATSPSIIPLSGTNKTQSGALGSLQWSHSFSGRTLNEARFGYNRLNYINQFETAFGGVNYWQQAGLTNLNKNAAYFALPAIIPGTNYASIGNGGSVPFFNISNIFQYSDVLTMTRGRHSMKVGAEIRRNQNFNQNGFGGNGLLAFTGPYTAQNPSLLQVAGAPGTGNGFADFLLGYASPGAGTPGFRFTAFDQSFSQLRNTDFMYYFQDDFRLNPQLTLNLGLRWELHTPYHDKSNGGSVFDFNTPGGRVLYLDKAFAALGNNPVYFGCCAPGSLINTDWRDWAPRIGFAWRPWKNNNKFVVRAGYGIFYDVLDNFYPTQSVSQNVPFLNLALPTPNGLESNPPIDIRNMFPAPFSIAQRTFPAPYCDAPSQSVINSQGIITSVLHLCPGEQTQLPNNKTPYLQQWGLNVEYAITPNLLVEIGYQGSHAIREPIQWIFNQGSPPPQTGNPNNSLRFDSQCPAGTLGTTCSPTQDRVPYKNFSQTAFANSNILASRYHALTLKVDKRFSHGLQTLLAFTWSHAVDQFSELQAQSGTVSSIAEDAHNLKLLWGSAAFDQTRRLVWNTLYELPFGRGKPLLNRGGVVDHLFGGWQLNQITTLSDGPPFDIACGCGDRAQIGNTFNVEHMDLVGNPLPAGFNRSAYQWFDPAAFRVPVFGMQGTAGRNILRTTHQTNTDFSIFKNNRITERVNLQFRAEFFNLFSSETSFPLFPVNRRESPDFGRIITRRVSPPQDHGNLFNPRVIQLALRLVF